MTRFATRLALTAALLGICSCAQPAHEQTKAIAKNKTETTPKSHRPVRINGRGKVTSISLTDFFPLQQSGKVLLYDARPYFFYALSHIPGAISMPKQNCDEEIEKRESEIKSALADGKSVVVYCTNIACPDARTVAIHLADYGYSSSTLTGGWDTWKESGLPTE